MSIHVLTALRVMVAVSVMTFGLAMAPDARAAPSAGDEIVTGTIVRIDAERDRPRVVIDRGGEEVSLRFPDRARVSSLAVGDVISVRGERDDDEDVFDVERLELFIRIRGNVRIERHGRSDRFGDRLEKQVDRAQDKLEKLEDKFERNVDRLEDKLERGLDRLEDHFDRDLARLEQQLDELEEDLEDFRERR